MAVVTSSLVSALRVGFQREFQDALSSAPSQWDRLSTRVPSSSAGNTYGWIGQFPKLREWSGDRSFKNIKEHGYSVKNNLYEATVRSDLQRWRQSLLRHPHRAKWLQGDGVRSCRSSSRE